VKSFFHTQKKSKMAKKTEKTATAKSVAPKAVSPKETTQKNKKNVQVGDVVTLHHNGTTLEAHVQLVHGNNAVDLVAVDSNPFSLGTVPHEEHKGEKETFWTF
jgi:transcription elongation GreA/GreB family factor